MSVHTAYTYLFVPGNRPERFEKAMASGADRVILDLEDAVAPADKNGARDAIQNWLPACTAGIAEQRIVVRINDARSHYFAHDLALLRALPACGVMLSKAESIEDLSTLQTAMQPGTDLLALVETAAGISACQSLAAHPAVTRLALGAQDLMADLNIPADSPTLDFAAAQLVLASRAAGLPAPVAGITASVNAEDTRADMALALRSGFGAKMCIHPTQLAGVRRALLPTEDDVEWARAISAAWDTAQNGLTPAGALQVNGQMVDKPVHLRALHILHRHQLAQLAG